MDSRPSARNRSRTANAPREKSIADSIRKWIAKQDGCHARKTHGGAYGGGGWPDIVASVNGHLLMLEVKRPGGAGATDLQRRELRTWHDTGAVCAVVRSLTHAKVLVEQMQYGSHHTAQWFADHAGDTWELIPERYDPRGELGQ